MYRSPFDSGAPVRSKRAHAGRSGLSKTVASLTDLESSILVASGGFAGAVAPVMKVDVRPPRKARVATITAGGRTRAECDAKYQ